MNYNAQQPFWGTFSANHVELHGPYAALVGKLLPVGRKWAREYFGLRGAAFPHSAYPVEMNVNPLGRETEEADLLGTVHEVLDRLPENPTADGSDGQVFVSVPGEDPETVYNVPIPCMTVFPGEEHGLESAPEELEPAARSYRWQKLEAETSSYLPICNVRVWGSWPSSGSRGRSATACSRMGPARISCSRSMDVMTMRRTMRSWPTWGSGAKASACRQ